MPIQQRESGQLTSAAAAEAAEVTVEEPLMTSPKTSRPASQPEMPGVARSDRPHLPAACRVAPFKIPCRGTDVGKSLRLRLRHKLAAPGGTLVAAIPQAVEALSSPGGKSPPGGPGLGRVASRLRNLGSLALTKHSVADIVLPKAAHERAQAQRSSTVVHRAWPPRR